MKGNVSNHVGNDMQNDLGGRRDSGRDQHRRGSDSEEERAAARRALSEATAVFLAGGGVVEKLPSAGDPVLLTVKPQQPRFGQMRFGNWRRPAGQSRALLDKGDTDQ